MLACLVFPFGNTRRAVPACSRGLLLLFCGIHLVEGTGCALSTLPGVNSVLFCIMGIDNAAVLSRRVRADSLLKQAPGRAFRRGLVEGRRLSPDLSRGRCRRVSPVRLFGSIVPTGKPAMFETAHLKGQRVIVYYALISGAFVAEPVRRDCPPIS